MKLKIISFLLAFLMLTGLLAGLLAGCGDSKRASTAAANRERDGDIEMVSFTDSAGRTVEIPKNITRISPSGTTAQMLLLAIAPDLMVSIPSSFSMEAKEFISPDYFYLPIVGKFYGSQDLNYEEIASVGPQVVIDLGDSKEAVAEDMDTITDAIGIPAIHIEATTDSVAQAFRTLGQILNREEAGERLASYCERVYGETQDIMAQVGDGAVRLLYCLGDSGLNVTATGSFQSEIINLVSDNVAKVDNPTSRGSGNEVDLEQILLWDPDVIFFSPESIYDTVGSNPAWNEVTAIKTGRYYKVPMGPYNWMGFPPSVNRYLGMMWSVSILYPEYAKFDLYERVAEYFELFYHCEITHEQYDRLLADSLALRPPLDG